MTEKATFVMYKSWRQLFKSLPKEQAADLICAIYDYQTDGECDIADPAVAAMFNMIRETMDADSAKYDETLKKRKEAGSRGGRPKKQEKAKESKRKHLVSDAFFEKHLQASESKSKQKNPVSESVSVSVYDSVSVNDNVSDSSNEEIVSLSSNDDNSSAKPTREHVPYQEVVEKFNEICLSLPQVQKLTPARRQAIKGRCSEYSVPEIVDVFRRAENSDFLSGRNGNWNGCSFDWLMKPANFLKVLEGNYENKSSPDGPDGFPETNNPFLRMLWEEEHK